MIVKIGDEFIDLSHCIKYGLSCFCEDGKSPIRLEYVEAGPGEARKHVIEIVKVYGLDARRAKVRELTVLIYEGLRNEVAVITLD